MTIGSKSWSGIIGREAYPGAAAQRLRAFQASSIGQRRDHSSGGERVARRLGVGRRLVLDEVLDLEAGGVRSSRIIVAVRDRELDGAVRVGPVEPMHAEVRTHQRLARRQVVVGEREHREVGMPEEDQLARPGAAGARPRGSTGTGRTRSPRRTRRSARSNAARRAAAPARRRRAQRERVSPNSRWNRRRSRAGGPESSSPTGRAPRRASHDET